MVRMLAVVIGFTVPAYFLGLGHALLINLKNISILLPILWKYMYTKVPILFIKNMYFINFNN